LRVGPLEFVLHLQYAVAKINAHEVHCKCAPEQEEHHAASRAQAVARAHVSESSLLVKPFLPDEVVRAKADLAGGDVARCSDLPSH
jgi:hypothetical protein